MSLLPLPLLYQNQKVNIMIAIAAVAVVTIPLTLITPAVAGAPVVLGVVVSKGGEGGKR